MRIKRGFAILIAALTGAVGLVIAAPPAAAGAPTITGSAVCDAATSSWTVTWTVTNTDETPAPIVRVSVTPAAPVTTLTGIAEGDVIPPRAEGPLTATAVVHSYSAGSQARLGLTVQVGDDTTTFFGTVSLPTVCGTPVPPVPTFQSRCDDLLVAVALPFGAYPVNVEVFNEVTGQVFGSLLVQPGPPVESISVPWDEAAKVGVRIPGIRQLGSGSWAYPATCRPPSLGTFELFSHANYRNVTATNETSLVATALGTSQPDSDFEFHDVGGGDVAIRAVDRNRFVSVSATDGLLAANSHRVVGDAQKFRIVTNVDGTQSLQSKLNGSYVTADREGRGPLVANRATIGRWEKFNRYPAGKGPVPMFAYINGQYVSAAGAGVQPLIANRNLVGLWEQFQVEQLGNGNIALKAAVNGKYVCAEAAGTRPLVANRTAVGPWETFRLVVNQDQSISLLAAANNRYVTAESAGTKPLIANRAAIGPWEKFQLPF